MVAQPRPSGQPRRGNRNTTLYAAGRRVASVNTSTQELEESAYFSTRVLRRPRPALAFLVKNLDAAERLGALRVRIHDIESGNVYRAAIKTIREQGTPRTYNDAAQLALPLSMWSCSLGRKQAPAPQASLVPDKLPAISLQQLNLFGEAAR
jgi:hypothetical protein